MANLNRAKLEDEMWWPSDSKPIQPEQMDEDFLEADAFGGACAFTVSFDDGITNRVITSDSFGSCGLGIQLRRFAGISAVGGASVTGISTSYSRDSKGGAA